MEIEQQAHQDYDKSESDAENIIGHRAGDNEISILTAPARFIFHHSLIRWERGQRPGSECIHDQVYP